MLKSRNLDDQSYEQIVEAAEGRLPWLCPAWTDHNAHDPGITVLELMAWYKEMQQYHLNQFTEQLRCKLLKLAGIARRPAAPAVCAVEVAADSPAYPALSHLETREGIPFELAEPIPAKRPQIARICVAQGERLLDVGEMLGGRRMTFQPFASTGQDRACLQIAFSQLGEGDLRLWFDVEEPAGVGRNPFAGPDQAPRVLKWECPGGAEVLEDGTHALSKSGYVRLRSAEEWTAAEDGFYWLTVSLEDAGCEEEVRLSGIFTGRYQAVQQETWARSHRFQAPAQAAWETLLADAQARSGELAVFIRQETGWAQTPDWQGTSTEAGLLVQLDTHQAVQDEGENVWIVSLDPLRAGRLLFDAKGLPGETFFLDLEGRTALTENFTLLCETLDRDGQVRPAPWHCVDDFYQCGPRDRVFTYDPLRETVTFGDGEHGALLRPGNGAVLAAELTLSYCRDGNIPAGQQLHFADGTPVENSAAAGGAARETAAEAQGRLLRLLGATRKCASAQDYERLAQETPGLRVAAAKAVPAYDPDEPTGVSRTPTVTVVVVPGGSGERKSPDGRFLAAVEQQLDRVRPVGTCVRVVPPAYIDVTVTAAVRSGGELDRETLARQIQSYFAGEDVGIGGTIRTADVAALVQALPGVEQVREVDLRAVGNGCYQNSEGDIQLPRRGVPCLTALKLERLSLGGGGR